MAIIIKKQMAEIKERVKSLSSKIQAHSSHGYLLFSKRIKEHFEQLRRLSQVALLTKLHRELDKKKNQRARRQWGYLNNTMRNALNNCRQILNRNEIPSRKSVEKLERRVEETAQQRHRDLQRMALYAFQKLEHSLKSDMPFNQLPRFFKTEQILNPKAPDSLYYEPKREEGPLFIQQEEEKIEIKPEFGNKEAGLFNNQEYKTVKTKAQIEKALLKLYKELENQENRVQHLVQEGKEHIMSKVSDMFERLRSQSKGEDKRSDQEIQPGSLKLTMKEEVEDKMAGLQYKREELKVAEIEEYKGFMKYIIDKMEFRGNTIDIAPESVIEEAALFFLQQVAIFFD